MKNTYYFEPISVAHMGLYGGSLLKENNKEVVESLGGDVLDVNWDAYYRLESVGALRILGAFRDTQLIGYAVFLVSASMHRKTERIALSDTVFVTKSERKGSVGIRLVKMGHEFMETLGVDRISWYYKAGSPLEKILLRLGYSEDDRVMSKRLVRGRK